MAGSLTGCLARRLTRSLAGCLARSGGAHGMAGGQTGLQAQGKGLGNTFIQAAGEGFHIFRIDRF